jgi:hypothetical protein
MRMENWRQSPLILNLDTGWRNGQLHVLTAFTPEHSLVTPWMAGWLLVKACQWSLFSAPGTKPRFLGQHVRSLSLYPLHYADDTSIWSTWDREMYWNGDTSMYCGKNIHNIGRTVVAQYLIIVKWFTPLSLEYSKRKYTHFTHKVSYMFRLMSVAIIRLITRV